MNLVTVEPVWQPDSQQRGFRALLEAMSFPGRILNLRDALGDSPAALGILAFLADDEVTYADPDGLLDRRERGLLGSREAAPETADYVLCAAETAPAEGYRVKRGELYRPDDSATVILRGAAVGSGPLRLRLTGPGIQTTAELALDGFHPDWLARRAEWNNNFPQGVDFFLCDRERVAALPRTCRVEVL